MSKINHRRINNAMQKILADTAQMSYDEIMTMCCGIAGQIIAAKANGNPTKIWKMSELAAATMKKTAQLKMLHDDEQRRKGGKNERNRPVDADSGGAGNSDAGQPGDGGDTLPEES